jgi:hypothetical protein
MRFLIAAILLATLIFFTPVVSANPGEIVVSDADTVWTPNLVAVSADVIDSTDAPSQTLAEAFVGHADTVWKTRLQSLAPADTTPPTVSGVSPEDGGTDVPIDTVIMATFSEAMDSSTITTGSFTLAGSAVSGTVAYDPATYTATFTPDANLDYNHEYTATLSTAITDLAGNSLTGPYSWSFTIEVMDHVLPSVVDLRELPLSGVLLDTLPSEGEILRAEFSKETYHAGEEVNINVTVKNTGLNNGIYFLDLYIVNSRNELVATSDLRFNWCGIVFTSDSGLPSYSVYYEDMLPQSVILLGPSEEYIFTAHWNIPSFLITGEYRLISLLDTGESTTVSFVKDWRGVVDRYDIFFIINEGTTYDELPVFVNLLDEGFHDLEDMIEPFYSKIEYNEFFPAFVSVKIEEYDQDINLVLTTSLREVKKEYGLVQINTFFIDNTGWDAWLDSSSLETSVYTKSSFSGCWKTWGQKRLIDFAGDLTSGMLKEAGKQICGWIFTKATGLPTWPLTIMLDAFSVATCYGNGHEAYLENSNSFFAYLPLDTEINVRARAYVDYTNAESTVPVWGLPGVVEGSWNGVITKYDGEVEPHSINLYLTAEETDYDWLSMSLLQSPGEIRVYDSYGEITGLVDGEIVNTIPKSRYDMDANNVVIFGATDDYTYEIAGKEEGDYGLEVTSVQEGEPMSFIASDIPTTSGAVHQYTIDWDALSRGEDGVTVQVDFDGDGTFERSITSDGELTHNEFIPPSSGCFIATATYSSPMAEEVQTLRNFRDQYLLTNPLGQALVHLYYKISPPIANFITDHPNLKPIVRALLVPAVAMSTIAVNTTSAEKMTILGLSVLVSVIVAIWMTRRRHRGSEYV